MKLWSYVKGLLLGLLLLWLILVGSIAVSDGFMAAGVYGLAIASFAFHLLQISTGGLGLYILGFFILALWVWSFGKKDRIQTAAEPQLTIESKEPNIK